MIYYFVFTEKKRKHLKKTTASHENEIQMWNILLPYKSGKCRICLRVLSMIEIFDRKRGIKRNGKKNGGGETTVSHEKFELGIFPCFTSQGNAIFDCGYPL